MRYIFMTAATAILFSGALAALAPGSIRQTDGTAHEARNILAETVSGILWESGPNVPGVRVRLWDVESVNYRGTAMDDYNRMPRALTGGRSSTLLSAASYLKDPAPAGYSATQWQRIQLSCRYFVAMGHYIDKKYDLAISGLEEYIKEAEKAENIEKSGTLRATFNSKVGGKAVSDAGGLNRYYLDALETLGMAYIQRGDGKSAREKAFTPLQELTTELARSGGREYFDWAIRALRASAEYAESQEDFKSAQTAYEELQVIAVRKEGGRQSRASYEAQLKVGFMLIKARETRAASAKFTEAVNSWNNSRGPNAKNPPRNDWINPDIAYLTAGSFVGQAMVKALEARRSDEWAEVLELFSTSLAIFNADTEIRAMGLLGAANAAAQLAELTKDKMITVRRGDQSFQRPVTSQNYAKLAEKYVAELQTLFGRSKMAEDPSLVEIQAKINLYKGD